MSDTMKDKIEQALGDLVDRKGIVFWYDSDGEMKDFAETLSLPGVEVMRLDNNPFTVKHRILTGEQPERGFVVYSAAPRPGNDEDNWLLDLELSGGMFSADRGSLYAVECGISMELKASAIDRHLQFFSNASYRKDLKGLDLSGKNCREIEKTMLGIVCMSEPTCDQLTYALAREAVEGNSEMADILKDANLDGIYWEMVRDTFGYDGNRGIKDLVIALFTDDLNRHLNANSRTKLTNEAHIFMRDWRDSRQNGELYKQWARALEKELNISQKLRQFTLDTLRKIETYPCVDKIIAICLQNDVLNSTMSVETMEDIVAERQDKLFWSEAAHTIMALLEARRLFEDIDRKMNGLIINSPEEGFNLYKNELYTIDLHYRHYFKEQSMSESAKLLPAVTEKVQRTYTNDYLMLLAAKWQPMVDGMKKWQIPGILSQRHFYFRYVMPYVDRGNRIFVIISDALRYETMVELEQRIAAISRMKTSLKEPMVSMLPSYTQLGMAALLPNRELSYEREADVVYADGLSTQGTESRNKILQKKIPASIAMRAKDFLATKDVKTAFKDYKVVYIYSNVIDKAGDNKDTESQVFKATEDEFDNILRIIETIRNANGNNILITADHGYLYQNETLDESDFTDFRVMGDSINDTRRFVIGHNLQPGAAVNSWTPEAIGLKSGIEVQTAKGMNRIRKQGSGSRFVHGGSMLQEIVVPLLHVNIRKNQDVGQVDVDILNQRARLTTGSQTINFYQTEPVTEKRKSITLRAGFYDDTDNLISDTVTLTFDSANIESDKREQKHTFIFKQTLSRLNGHEATLRLEKQVPGSEQFSVYKEFPFKVSVMFQAEF